MAQNGLFAVLEGFGVPDTEGVQETRGVHEMEASAQSSSLTEYAGGEQQSHVAGMPDAPRVQRKGIRLPALDHEIATERERSRRSHGTIGGLSHPELLEL